MAVVKADAYGHGITQPARPLSLAVRLARHRHVTEASRCAGRITVPVLS